MKSDTSRVPEGWLGLDVEGVYVKGNQLVVVGEPDEQIEHNCDAMGCGSLDHVLFRCTLPKWQAVEQPLAPDGETHLCGGKYYTDKVLGEVCCRCQAPRR